MKYLLLLLGLSVVVFGLADAPQSPVAFEVASVKASGRKSGDTGGTKGEDREPGLPDLQLEHARLTAANFNLYGLIVKAYGLTSCRPLGAVECAFLVGGPAWLRKDGFDIQAKMPAGSPDYTLIQFMNGRAPELQLMLQALLADRFHLRVHRETRQVPVYALAVGKKGLKVKKADEAGEPTLIFRPSVLPNGAAVIQLVCKNRSLDELGDLLSKFMDRPVLNQTGHPEKFDFTLEYEAIADAPGAFSAATGPALLRALQEQAGLQLEPTRGPVNAVVIDHAERPSEN